jgi:hypothetical protein
MGGALEMAARLHVDLKLGPNWEDMHALVLDPPAMVVAAH